MLRAQQLARQDVKADRGYAMMMTSIVTIMLFSLMGAFLTMTNIAKSSTDAYIDGNNTFYAAESGLNRRANELRQRFENYNSPSDGATTAEERTQADRVPTKMKPCYSKDVISPTNPATSNDFECRNYPYKYSNRFGSSVDKNGAIVLNENQDNNSAAIEYKAYTFVRDNTNYDTASTPAPIPIVIPIGPYIGLNAQEYRYTVNSTAAKPNPNILNGKVEESGDNKTVLQMDFRSRSIPLFQFGAFYNGDLELNPSPQMDFNGRMHSNGNMYLTGGNRTTLRIDGNITVYQGQGTLADPTNEINIGNPPLPSGYSAGGVVQIQKTPGAGFATPAALATIANLPTNGSPLSTAVPIADFTPYNGRIQKVANRLTPPPPGFLGKLDANLRTGEYYGKADLRLEMFPDRAVPFTLQVLASNTGTPGGCGTGVFAGNVIDRRADYSSLKCTNLTKGQLRSLMQPVLVRPRSDAEYRRFCPNSVTTPATPPAISTTDLTVRERILDALYFTLVAQIGAVPYSSTTNAATGKMSAFTPASDQFRGMLTNIQNASPGQLTTDDINRLSDSTPAQIAALSSTITSANPTPGSCFMAAPIQALFTPGANAATTSSFFDGRESRPIQMLQTNIESLTVWNRDGLFVPVGLFDESSTINDTPLPAATLAGQFSIDGSLNWTGRINSSGDNLLFTKITAPVTNRVDNVCDADGRNCAPQNTPLPPSSFRRLGLAAQDLTEGGLVIHATIDKSAYPYPARQSPYGFAFNGGANLPAPLTIATDQAVYSQGDWNISLADQPTSQGADKQPASFLSDTITVLSNNCLATVGQPNVGKLNCGIQTGTAIGVAPNDAATTTINAAFLGRTDVSTTAPEYFSGGLNNYMRLLEDWNVRGSKTLNYSGSFISLGAPLEVSGAYRGCVAASPTTNYACPPTRNWQYDTSFNAFVGLPPLPPRVIELQQDSFKRRP